MDPILFIPPVKEPRLLEDHFAQILKRAGGARTRLFLAARGPQFFQL